MENYIKIYQGDKRVKCGVTSWFDADVKPHHMGFYNVGSDEINVLLEWDGEYWRNGFGDKTSIKAWGSKWRGWTGELL